MAKLYGQCFAEDNINLAITTILQHQGSRTPGPDGITKDNINMDRVIKEVRMRLRRITKANSRQVQIPKDNGKVRQLTICNLYDRIAQQAIYQVIYPILESNMSQHSYGFRKGISAKLPVAKACNAIARNKNAYTIEIDFAQCFDNIPLEKAIGAAKKLGITNSKLLATIKHLMYISREYNGIGLGQGTILGPILANCYLDQIDRWVEDHMELDPVSYHTARDLKRHPSNYMQWLLSNNRKPKGKYYRYADDSVIIVSTRAEQLWVYNQLKQFINNELDITINEEKTKLGYNELVFLGFRIAKIKDQHDNKLSITPGNPQAIHKKIRLTKWKTPEQVRASLKVIIGLINYYDICNNFGEQLRRIGTRLMKIACRRGTALSKEDGRVIFTYSYKGQEYIIDIYELRKATKTSIKEYLINSSWLKTREELTEIDNHAQAYHPYKWALWTLQKGIDPITQENIYPKCNDIHHINGNHKDNRLSNLILVNSKTHELIHSKIGTKNKRLIKYRKALMKND